MRRLAIIWGSLSLLLLVVSSIFVARLISDRDFRREVEQANADLNAGSYADARERLMRLHTVRPDHAEVAFRLGACEQARGEPERALAVWSRLDPESTWFGPAALSSANAALSLGRLATAEKLLRAALRQPRPETAETLHILTILLVQQGRSQEAARLIESVWDTVSSTMPDARATRLALLRDHVGLDFETFPLEFNLRLLKDAPPATDPDNRRAVALARAHLATDSGDFAIAEAELTYALQNWPDDRDLWKSWLDWAMAAGRPDAVVRAVAVIPRMSLDRGYRHWVQAWLAQQRHESDKELRALEALLEVCPASSQALTRLAEVSRQAGRHQFATEIRLRKANLDAQRDRYHRLYKEDRYSDHLEELEILANRLDRNFESQGFRELRAKSNPDVAARPKEQILSSRLEAARPAAGEPDDPGKAELATNRWKVSGADPEFSARSAPSYGSVPYFENAAAASGLAAFVQSNGVTDQHQLPEMSCGGVGLIDFDRDGHLDVYCVQGGPFPPPVGTLLSSDRLFRNRGDGSFEDVSDATRISKMPGGYGHGIAVSDYDNDGHSDLFITRWKSYALYRNRGDGTFEDRTRESGLGGERDWPTSAAFADFDNDGDLDLYVCHYGQWDERHPTICKDPSGTRVLACDPRTINSSPDHLFRNDRGHFIDISLQAGIKDHDGRGLGVVAADVDEDGRVDIFVANDTTANFLFRNRGDLLFEEVAHEAGVAASASGGYQAGMGVACGDINGDGRFDLAVTNYYGESTTLFVNLGHGFFSDQTAASGLAAPSRQRLGFGAAFFDANNDGSLDLLTVNGHVSDQRPLYPYAMTPQLFLGSIAGVFLDVTASAGPALQEASVGRGLAYGDLDRDGRLDAIIAAQNHPVIQLHNVGALSGSHFVTLQLEGTRSNRDGIGSIVKLTAGNRTRIAQSLGGGSFQSASSRELHFGLGASERVQMIEVRWPSGQLDRHHGLEVDRIYRIREGDDALFSLSTQEQNTMKRAE